MPFPLENPAPPIQADMPDTELVSRAALGDGAAFEAIMRRHNRMLFRTARSIVKDDAEAEDVVQETYLSAWRSLTRYRAESKLSTWLVRIAVNEALRRLRRKSAQIIPLEAAMTHPDPGTRAFLADEPDREPEQLAMRAQTRRLMERRIDLLPDAFRTVFMLRVVEEMSVEEVAQALEIPEATVRTRLFRARGLLREGLAQEMDHALDDAFAFDGARCDRVVTAVLAAARAEGLCGGE
ncbi:RNA polymerase sigma factor [Stenotrophomonas sp. NLF4-10]|uniref:RNA polymerase sigma factor n=1 Tax=Stenotrophomonas sp. NLF4-10 TaxID=2918754 RepID=UPI001EFA745B|nr:RNA polymerase sigma factor [Stenotrophomonas sp. NLF4-10]MCG8274923.1 RNA polymerase sigma factor [Stenotrophomonas sp. NLF4-10]